MKPTCGGFLSKSGSIALLICLSIIGWLSACAPQPAKPSPGHLSTEHQSPVVAKEEIPPTVEQVPFLPPPQPMPPLETYSVVVNNVPVQQLLFALARDANLNIDIHSEVKGNVTLNAVQQTLPQIMERITKQVDLLYTLEDNLLTISPDKPYLHSYKVDYVNISRNSVSELGVAAQLIAGTSNTTGGGGGTSANISQNTIKNVSSNLFWETLGRNILALLGKTNAEIQEAVQSSSGGGGGSSGSSNQDKVFSLSTADVMFNSETGIVTIRATRKQHQEVQRFLDKVMSSAQRQVLIEATIVEVSLGDQYQAGIDWQRIAGDYGYAQNTLGGNLGKPPFYSFTYNNPSSRFGDLSLTVRLLEQFGDVKVLSSPKVTTLNNQTAILKVVDNKIYFTIAAVPSTQTNLRGDLVTAFTYATTPHELPVGLIMNVTPQISDGNQIILNVRPTISRIIGAINDPNPDLARAGVTSTIPEVQVREIESILKLNNGEIAVIGGLMQDTIKQNRTGVPVLSKLPIFGDLFSYRDDQYAKNELVIFLRPVVIKDPTINGDFKDYDVYLPNSQRPDRLPATGFIKP